MRFICDHVRTKHYRLTKHTTIVRMERGIDTEDLKHALLNGEIKVRK